MRYNGINDGVRIERREDQKRPTRPEALHASHSARQPNVAPTARSPNHGILEVPQGKVTLLVMPEGTVERPQHAQRAGLHSAVVPLPSGSVGIVGADAAVVDSVAGALRGTAA